MLEDCNRRGHCAKYDAIIPSLFILDQVTGRTEHRFFFTHSGELNTKDRNNIHTFPSFEFA